MNKHRLFPLWLLVLFTVLAVGASDASAATRGRAKPQKFSTVGVTGRKLLCVKMPGRKFEPGTLRGGSFTSELQRAQRVLRNARKPAAKKKAKKQLAQAKQNQKICRIGHAVPTATPTPVIPTPTPTSTPYPIPVSLDAYAGPVTDPLITRLLNVGGLGNGSREEVIVQTAKTQGLSAAVDQLFQVQPETAEFAACDYWLDGSNDGSPITTDNLTISGMRYWHFCQALNTANPAKFNVALYLMELTPVDTNFSDQREYQTWVSYWRDLLMSHAGNLVLPNFLIDMGRHPRMLDFLNNNGNKFDPKNKKDLSNENYARELQQLFALGPSYTDAAGQQQLSYVEGRIDPVTQAFNLKLGDHPRVAAIFSGWTIQYVTAADGSSIPTAVLNPTYHNPNVQKVYEGTPWQIDANQDDQFVMQLLAKHPAAPLFAAERLLKYFVTPNPDTALIRGVSTLIKQHNYNLSAVIPILLKSNAFYAEQNRNSIAVSPFKSVVKLVKALRVESKITINSLVNQLDQSFEITSPDAGVFGWEKARFNNTNGLPQKVNLAATAIEQAIKAGWTVDAISPVGVASSTDVVNALTARLGLTLSPTELGYFVTLFNNDMNGQGVNTPVPYDNTNATRKTRKVTGLVRASQGLPQWNFD